MSIPKSFRLIVSIIAGLFFCIITTGVLSQHIFFSSFIGIPVGVIAAIITFFCIED